MSEKLEQLYERALALPRDARASFAAEACDGDEKLRAELLSLLAIADAAEGFFANLGHAVFSPPAAAETTADKAVSSSQPSPSSRSVSRDESLPEGSVIGRYRIVGRLGVGGMGTVYRAHDTTLDRDVALKFLSAHLSSDPDAKQRLLVEARAAAALQHPNVCVVHEIGETPDGHPFIAMALCEGDTLKQRLAEGPLAPEEAAAIASQVARALSAAHSRQIVHRDVKPGNIILEPDGTVKLLDFGLAKSDDVTVTHPGSTPGTIAYMSPEQVRGEPLDQRTDLWSLGVVLYEMLAGRRPFPGANDRVVLQAILHDDPDPLPEVRPDVPRNLADVVERLLRKDRDARYAGAAELLVDLSQDVTGHSGFEESEGRRTRSDGGPAPPVDSVPTASPQPQGVTAGARRALLRGWRRRTVVYLSVVAVILAAAAAAGWLRMGKAGSPSAPRTAPAIAVLRLATAEAADAGLALGMTEALSAMLANTSGLHVIANTSVNRFHGRQIDVRAIADSLRVDYILEGTLQRHGPQLRVRLRLVDGTDGVTRWSEVYDRELQDIFAVQDEIAQSVVDQLGLRLGTAPRALRRRWPTRNVAAYELYLRGSDPALTRSDSGTRERLRYFQEAVALDPGYAAAHAELATSYIRIRITDAADLSPAELMRLAEEAAARAVALDDSLAEAHRAFGAVRVWARDYAAAERAFKRAVALAPTDARMRESLAGLYFMTGRPQEELAEASRALELDPLSASANTRVAHALMANGRCDEAMELLKHIADVRPPTLRAEAVTAQCHALAQRWSEAIAALRPQADRDIISRAFYGYVLARGGQREEALRVHASLVERWRQRNTGAVYVGMVYTGLGELDQAFLWLNRGIDDGSLAPSPANGLILEPMFEELDRDLRFGQLRNRLGLQKR